MSPASTFIFLVFPMMFYLFLIKSKADEDYFTVLSHCPTSTRCKNGKFKEIKYPFWRVDDDLDENSATECGYPGFGIDCSNSNPNFPILYHYGDTFLVKDINYTDYTITLVDADAVVITKEKTCPRPRHNFTDLIEKSPLVYNDTIDLNLTFYLNCKENPVPGDSYQVDCLNKSYLQIGDSYGLDWSNFCEEKVETTVKKTEEYADDTEWWTTHFGGAMNDGFVLNWAEMDNCGHCEIPNGWCEQDKYFAEFLCYCTKNRAFIHVVKDCPSKAKGKSKVILKIVIGIGGVAFGAIAIGLCFFVYNKRHKKRSVSSSYLMSRSAPSYPSSSTNTDLEKSAHYHGVPLFDYNELEEATDNFNSKNELGDGGFGTVYKGKLRDGRVVAVKRLYENNYKRVEQFMNEIEILAQKRHKNLVTLYGCTSRHSRELLLIYEYVSNGTIADHLHGGHARPGSLTWTTRLSIAIETASALAYLHASDVIHRDVKTNNILLDDNFCVKVADFGLSRLFPIHATHVSTAPQGTPGYVDPEYHECYQLTSKSDVYSFGVVLIELISSLPAVDITRHRHEINLSNMAINKIQCNALHELVDKNLGFESDAKVREMITAVAELAFQCLQSGKDLRPTMQQVLESLVEIQNMDSSTWKRDSKGSPTDSSSLLLKNNNEQTLSPNSVINAQWHSRSTTNSSSSY